LVLKWKNLFQNRIYDEEYFSVDVGENILKEYFMFSLGEPVSKKYFSFLSQVIKERMKRV